MGFFRKRANERFARALLANAADPPGPYREIVCETTTDGSRFMARAFLHPDGTAHVIVMEPTEALFSRDFNELAAGLVTLAQTAGGEALWFPESAALAPYLADKFRLIRWRAKD